MKTPVIEERESIEKHVKSVIEHIEHLLKEGSTADCIIDYSNVRKKESGANIAIYNIKCYLSLNYRVTLWWPINCLLKA